MPFFPPPLLPLFLATSVPGRMHGEKRFLLDWKNWRFPVSRGGGRGRPWRQGLVKISTVSLLQNDRLFFRVVAVLKNSTASLRIQHRFLLQFVFPDLVVERHAVDPENLGGPDDVPLVVEEDLANMLLLHFGEGPAAAFGHSGRPREA